MGTRDDKKKLIGEYLKAADRFIQASEFTEAMAEVKRALALEPGNMYALAYSQRIKSALESLRKKEDAARVRKITESAKNASAAQKEEAPAPDAPAAEPAAAVEAEKEAPPAPKDDERYTIRQQQAQIERFKKEVEALRLKHQQEISLLAEELQQAKAAAKVAQSASKEQDRATIERQQGEIEQLKKEIEALRQQQQQDLARREEDLRLAKDNYQAVVDDAEESHRRVEELYAEVKRLHDQREEALNAPAFDAITRESLLRDVVSHLLLADTLSAEANDVMELIRTKLGFDDDAFVLLQTSVKFDLYKYALEKAWTEGYITPEQAERLSELRKKIGVSAEDHFRLEAELRSAKKKR